MGEPQVVGVNVLRDQVEIRVNEWDLNLRSLEDRVGQSQVWGFAVKREKIEESWMAAFCSGQAQGSTIAQHLGDPGA